MGNEEKTMNEGKTYPEVMQHYSLGSSIVSIMSKPEVLPSSGDFPSAIWQCHHSRVVKTTQITQDLVDQSLSRSLIKPIVNAGPTHT
jgi:hypothetical protein